MDLAQSTLKFIFVAPNISCLPSLPQSIFNLRLYSTRKFRVEYIQGAEKHRIERNQSLLKN